MGSYLHFDKQTRKILEGLELSIDFAEKHATYPRSVADIPREPESVELPIA